MIFVAGPYIGNFEQEILTFRPYVRWLYEILDFEQIYINTHFNRFFLYKEFIPAEHMIPIFENLTRDESGQRGYIHKSVKPKDYQILVKTIKEKIIELENCSKKDIELFNVSYVKSTPPQSIYNKTFNSINVDDVENKYKDKIVFIPSNIDDRDNLLGIKNFLKDNEDFIIIGDKKTRFRDDNVVLNQVDYVENGWKLMVKIITDAKAVICPLTYWTTICNLQQTPVFTWGDQIGQHKPGGIYYFSNERCLAFPANNLRIILRMIGHFLEEVYNG